MEYIFPMLMLILFNVIPILYIVLMIYFLMSKDGKFKKAGKVMLGIFITILLIPIIFFIGCLAAISIHW